MEGSVHN